MKEMMDEKNLELALNEIEKSCGVILNELFLLTQNDTIKKTNVVLSIASCLTLTIKNIERNLCDQGYEISFEEILKSIKDIDFNFKKEFEKEIE